MARPTKLTPEVQGRIVRALRAGNFPDVAARLAGVHPATYYRWMERGRPGDDPEDEPYRRFRLEVEQAQAHFEALLVGWLAKAAKDGNCQAIRLLLERRFAERWGSRQAPGAPAPEDELDERMIDHEIERLLEQLAARDDR